MYKQDLASNNLQGLICHKTHTINQSFFDFLLQLVMSPSIYHEWDDPIFTRKRRTHNRFVRKKTS